MLQRSLKLSCLAKGVVFSASFLVVALSLCGCQTIELSDVTGSLSDNSDKIAADPRRDIDLYRERVRANPKDAEAALQYGSALRSSGHQDTIAGGKAVSRLFSMDGRPNVLRLISLPKQNTTAVRRRRLLGAIPMSFARLRRAVSHPSNTR